MITADTIKLIIVHIDNFFFGSLWIIVYCDFYDVLCSHDAADGFN